MAASLGIKVDVDDLTWGGLDKKHRKRDRQGRGQTQDDSPLDVCEFRV